MYDPEEGHTPVRVGTGQNTLWVRPRDVRAVRYSGGTYCVLILQTSMHSHDTATVEGGPDQIALQLGWRGE